MINLSAGGIVFNARGAELSHQVRAALELAVEQHLTLLRLEHINIDAIKTHQNLRAAFAKFIRGRVLRDSDRTFDESYVERALEAYSVKGGHLSKELFDLVMCADEVGPYSYMRSYGPKSRTGLGLFLVALHSSGAITLPFTFAWPRMYSVEGKGMEVGKYVSSELLGFVRTLEPWGNTVSHPAFEVIGGDCNRRSWFLSYATRLLLATGWHAPEDVNIADLMKIRASTDQINDGKQVPFTYGALLDVLNLAFPGRVNATAKDWADAMRVAREADVLPMRAAKAWQRLHDGGLPTDHDLLDEVLNFNAAFAKPQRMKSFTRLPGLEVDLRVISKVWLDLEELYVSKTARENYKGMHACLGWWNVYLFYYLAYWFQRHADCPFVFPASPALLTKSVFVSRLIQEQWVTPITFVEFMSALAERRHWKGNNHYALLLQLEGFFSFIERYSDELPGCKGFTQPLAPHDYPRTSRSRSSNKSPIPRRLFGVCLDYYEALLAHHTAVLDAVLARHISDSDMKLIEGNGNIIDTFATSHIVGFVPILLTPTKTIPLQFIPNVLDMHRRPVRGGRTLNLPHPHALHQNLVALHTGIRHNHIQWLDKDKFDSLVTDADREFSTLFVNTDKQKTEPWAPYVNYRVIELLRAQRHWCDLIENPKFDQERFYNDNPRTKWPAFRPLFAYTNEGRPHSDELYSDVWKSVLCGLQGLMSELAEFGEGAKFIQLLPPTSKPHDSELSNRHDATIKTGECCLLRVFTESTPHSARVAVVTQYITFLPTDLIGKYITGQTPATVAYYVHLDPEVLESQQVHQASQMRNAALRAAFEPVVNKRGDSAAFIHADEVNSNLARSMQVNFEETVIAHGGMCITFSERTKHGLDVLRETACADIAFNKTEICPYGNNCPSDVVKDLKGLRRCSLCAYAVRFIDHLPAVMVKKRQIADAVDALEGLLSIDTNTLYAKYTPGELDLLEEDRARLCEDLTGWILNEEALEIMRQRLASGQDDRQWTVQRPEIIERDLRRVSVQTSESEYLLARLGECIAFPMLESPQVRARFDVMRRELLARSGNIREAFSSTAVDPALECAGMLRTIIESQGYTLSQIAALLDGSAWRELLPDTQLRLLSGEDLT